MPKVIIDNSTLSAVQRLSGTAPAPNSYDVQGDYSALEGFLATLLLNDDFYFIDDYKSEFRAKRRAEFSYCRAIALDAFPNEDAIRAARALTDDLILDIRAGRLHPGLVKEFLDSIGLHLTGAWHMQSSNFFLALKVLAGGGDELKYKYSSLTALIYSQLTGQENVDNLSARVRLIDSFGQPIPSSNVVGNTKYEVGSELIEFASALNWLTLRASFYLIVSGIFDASVALHPIRHNFVSRWSAERNTVALPDIWRKTLAQYLSDQSAAAVNAINQATEPATIGIDLPLFAAWSVGRTGSVTDAISFVLDVRQGQAAINIRHHLNELDELRRDGNVSKFKLSVNKLRAAIETETAGLVRKYGGEKTSGFAPTVSILAQIAPLPVLSIEASVELPQLKLAYGPPKHFRALMRNVVDDIVRFDSLGGVRGALLRQVQRTEGFTMPALRVEDARYFGRESHWKKPM